MLVISLWRLTVFRLLHPEKVPLLISLTVSGMVISSRLVQSSKALDPIFVTLFGIVILVSEVDPLKALSSISST